MSPSFDSTDESESRDELDLIACFCDLGEFNELLDGEVDLFFPLLACDAVCLVALFAEPALAPVFLQSGEGLFGRVMIK